MTAWVRAAAFLLAVLVFGPADGDDTLPKHSAYLEGQFLVAAPEIGDPRFRETVILVIEHDAGGAFGLIVNKPLAVESLAAFLEATGVAVEEIEGDITLYYGGPVEPEKGFILHGTDWESAATRRLGPGLNLTADASPLIATGRGDGPAALRLILGYAGWGPGQLDAEMARGDWVASPADPGLLFAPGDESKWDRILGKSGIPL